MPTYTKAQIQQQLNVSDETIEKLKQIDGNVYIVQSNTGSINTHVNPEGLHDCLEAYYKDGIGFKDIVRKVKQVYIKLALQDSQNVSAAARKIGIDYRMINYYLEDKD